jgi:hypothetical protein
MNNSKKRLMRTALQQLIGSTMWAGGRTVDLVWLYFGDRRQVLDRWGEPKEVGDLALHLQCFWLIQNATQVYVASGDMFFSRDPNQDVEHYDWTEPNTSRCDEGLEGFFQNYSSSQLVVQAVHVNGFGCFSINFGSGIKLRAYIDNTTSSEKWRLFRPYTDDSHYVMTSEIEIH